MGTIHGSHWCHFWKHPPRAPPPSLFLSWAYSVAAWYPQCEITLGMPCNAIKTIDPGEPGCWWLGRRWSVRARRLARGHMVAHFCSLDLPQFLREARDLAFPHVSAPFPAYEAGSLGAVGCSLIAVSQWVGISSHQGLAAAHHSQNNQRTLC